VSHWCLASLKLLIFLLNLPSTGITDMSHHAGLKVLFFL
jgi:hypothetical protein